jgi:hypothetical protein
MMRLALGIDFAAADRELGMCAVLTWIDESEDGARKVYSLYAVDEVVMPGTTTMEAFARRILKMLEEHGIQWHELDQVYGDNPVRARGVVSSVGELAKWIARLLGTHRDNLKPQIRSMKEDAGQSHARRRTKDIRCRWMYNQIGADRVRVSTRCKTLLKGLAEWDYGDSHPLKDVLDGWMYGLKDQWKEAERWGMGGPTVRF